MFIYSSFDKDSSDPKYSLEALISAVSLRKHVRQDINLVTSSYEVKECFEGLAYNPFSEIRVVDKGLSPKLQKIRSISEFGERNAVFIDTDTIVLDDLSKVFNFCDFDLAAAPAIWRESVTSMEEAVRQERLRQSSLNSGLLFVRKDFVSPLVNSWAEEFQKEEFKTGRKAADQPPLTRALEELKPEVLKLPINYNYRTNFGGLLSGKCFVVHGHFFPVARKVMRTNFSLEVIERFLARVSKVNAEMKTRNFRRYTDISLAGFEKV